MSCPFIHRLRWRKHHIEEHWRTLLKIEPCSGPLSNPETLQFLIPEMCERVFTKGEELSDRKISLEEAKLQLPACSCGNNPYRAFFVAGEQAITDAAILLSANLIPQERDAHAIGRLMFAVRSIAADEIDTFCGACVHHGVAKGCRFVSNSA